MVILENCPRRRNLIHFIVHPCIWNCEFAMRHFEGAIYEFNGELILETNQLIIAPSIYKIGNRSQWRRVLPVDCSLTQRWKSEKMTDSVFSFEFFRFQFLVQFCDFHTYTRQLHCVRLVFKFCFRNKKNSTWICRIKHSLGPIKYRETSPYHPLRYP